MTALTSSEISALENVGFNRWQKGNYDRLYINAGKLGLKCTYYKTGNISGSEFNGCAVSHAEAYRMKAAKTFIDVKTGELTSTRDDLEEAATELMEKTLDELHENEKAEAEAKAKEAEEVKKHGRRYAEYTLYGIIPADEEDELERTSRRIAERQQAKAEEEAAEEKTEEPPKAAEPETTEETPAEPEEVKEEEPEALEETAEPEKKEAQKEETPKSKTAQEIERFRKEKAYRAEFTTEFYRYWKENAYLVELSHGQTDENAPQPYGKPWTWGSRCYSYKLGCNAQESARRWMNNNFTQIIKSLESGMLQLS